MKYDIFIVNGYDVLNGSFGIEIKPYGKTCNYVENYSIKNMWAYINILGSPKLSNKIIYIENNKLYFKKL
jgi:hypothetical protein